MSDRVTNSDAKENDQSPDDCPDGSCREAVEELYGYLDGELDDAKRETIKSHVDDCQPCLEMFDFHGELKEMVGQKCRTELPEGLRDRVLQALESFDDPSV